MAINYKTALELNESRDGLDLKSLSLEDLLALIEEIPGWDYPLGEESILELARRAGIDAKEYFDTSDKDYSDLWSDSAEALGVEF